MSQNKRKPGRPAGSKTRADAPSRQKLAVKNSGVVPAPRAPRPSEIKPSPQNVSQIVETKSVIAAEKPATQSDETLFGSIKSPAGKPAESASESYVPNDGGEPVISENTAGAGPDGGENSNGMGGDGPANEPEPVKPKPEDSEAQRPLVTVIIDSVLGFLATMIGKFWHPRPIGNGDGQCPYDERERLIASGSTWFASMAIALLTPGQMFATECFNYTMPRLKDTFEWARLKFMKRAKPAAPPRTTSDPRTPQPAPGNVTVEPAKP